MSCVEKTKIHSCEKVQNFMLQPTLTELLITECPELDELPSLSRLSCIKEIGIDSCEKLEKISGIEERPLLWILLGSNAVIRNCIHKLKSVPRKLNMIGRAVDGTESSLSKFLFYDAHIGPDALTEIVTQNRGDVDIYKWCKKWNETRDETRAAVIVCFVVVTL
ncbi:hypothetical protein SUGI_0465880 [Cryptomeria japonica]|nr:hypothetical protein SUGI_0465880 [Cryptomeria japonica]